VTLELMIEETLDRKLADVRVPRVDVPDVRRTGRGRRRARLAANLAAALVIAGTVTAATVGRHSEQRQPTTPVAIPAMDFTPGLRGFFDPQTGRTHLAGQNFELSDAQDLGTSATATPLGLVFFDPDQSVRLLRPEGRVYTLAASPARPEAFSPTAKHDPYRELIVWLTRGAGRVTLSVYGYAGQQLRLVGSYPVPCSGAVCDSLEVAAVDRGVVFVRDDNGTRTIDPFAGPDADWSTFSEGRVSDARNGVVLSWQDELTPLPPAFVDTGWRQVLAHDRDSLLTFDGAYEVYASPTLASTGGGEPLALGIPPGPGELEVNVDSDGSVLVARSDGETDVFWDCMAAVNCVELGRLADVDGDPVFIGDNG